MAKHGEQDQERHRIMHVYRTLAAAIPVLLVPFAGSAQANTPEHPASQAVASVATQGVSLHGAISVADGRAQIANNGDITAADKSAAVMLARGGQLLVCASTTIHIAKDAVPQANSKPADAGLMFSLDRGAFETDYLPASYSDVVMTPDLRLLISPPGAAHLKLRVNEQGDTCVDNAGENAPYVTVSSLSEGGVYRVRPGQRVLFVKGSLQEVVDNEREPCGCPVEAPTPALAVGGKPAGGPSSKLSDTEFPLAVSEGLKPPPGPSSEVIVPAGQPHAQVAATLSSTEPPGPPPPEPAVSAAAKPVPVPTKAAPRGGFLHSVGHFFSRVFGGS
ncbi:hypothetical protein [Acidipila sp. EB88]|uniref:hypothetical protein n=1 Tax=Acidipila sp. EB88 TaxID=2305226 RepID=UPI000F5EFA07|nr:hypothetical protein [Acidipila sp. EB88]RRA47724.1 hypothetical protein D1Y84_04855 [Acidipila sp. EB88]